MLSEGAWVTPNVRLERPLGAGGMGSVWVAEHTTLRTKVVVKLMRPELAKDPETLQRFSREAAAAANVKSPHVVQVFDHGVASDGSPFITMELLEGEDLGGRLKRGPIPPDEVAVMLSQMAKALMQAHQRGIVHRDIKPQNIFLCSGYGETFIKVLDFGIAKAGGDLQVGLDTTSTGAVMGTPYYMSPEQALGHKTLDFRTDLWALGVVVYEMLTGSKPFVGESVGALAIAICTRPLPLPSVVNPALGPSIDAWFQRACAREAPMRFASAKEMSDAFAAAAAGPTSLGLAHTVASGQPVSLPPPPSANLGSTTTAPTSRGESIGPQKSSRIPALVAVMFGGAILTFAIFIVLRSRPTPTPAAPTQPSHTLASATTTAPPEETLAPLMLAPSTTPTLTTTAARATPTHSAQIATTPTTTHAPAHPASNSFDRNSIE